MTVTVRDARTQPGDRKWIQGVYREYMDDLGLLNTGIFPSLGEIGHREPDQLERWFMDSSATLLTIVDDGQPAGFALVARDTRTSREADYRMAEFFISRPYRRRGLGRSAVGLILRRFAGRWEIVEYSRNPAAVKFWRNVVSAFTRGDFRERSGNGEVRQYFTSSHSHSTG
ncbi:MAG: GNAT family N-acetyltransferase [Steroidobacteraceae bacterium]